MCHASSEALWLAVDPSWSLGTVEPQRACHREVSRVWRTAAKGDSGIVTDNWTNIVLAVVAVIVVIRYLWVKSIR